MVIVPRFFNVIYALKQYSISLPPPPLTCPEY
jgi:hypothetical protein